MLVDFFGDRGQLEICLNRRDGFYTLFLRAEDGNSINIFLRPDQVQDLVHVLASKRKQAS